MRTLRNAARLARTPAMWPLYARWLCTGPRTGLPLKADPERSLAGWSSFSECWSFHDGLPGREFLFLERIARSAAQPPLALDVGANIGLFTLELALLGFRVHAFEPVPSTFERLRANVRSNRIPAERLQLNCAAVGDFEGTVGFAVDERSASTSHAVLGPGAADSLVHVPCTTLDTYCSANDIGFVDLLKIDVEGLELHVLRGARRMLSGGAVGAVLLEVCPGNLARVGVTPADLGDLLARSGYTIHALLTDGSAGPCLTTSDLQSIDLANLIAVRTAALGSKSRLVGETVRVRNND